MIAGEIYRRKSVLDTRPFRDALGQFPTGVTIITTVTAGGERLGMTISSFNSLSLDPPLVLVSIWRKANSFVVWQQAKRYAINVLRENQEGLSKKFAYPKGEKWIGQTVLAGKTGLPLLPNAVIAFKCEACDRHDGDDQEIFVGRVSIGAWAPSRRMRRPIFSISCTDGEAPWASTRSTTNSTLLT